MNTTVTKLARIDASPRFAARTAGVLYLGTILTGLFAEGFVSERLLSGDPASVAAAVLANRDLVRLAFAVYLVEMACDVAMTALFYRLLAPVSRNLSLLAACLGLVGCAIKTLGRLFFVAPLILVGSDRYAAAFGVDGSQALAYLFLRLNNRAAEMGLVFFGFSALLEGWLVLRSTFLPRALGVVSLVGGVGWLLFLWPPLAHRFLPVILAVGVLGALAMVAWLLVVGVNETRWREQERAAAAP